MSSFHRRMRLLTRPSPAGNRNRIIIRADFQRQAKSRDPPAIGCKSMGAWATRLMLAPDIWGLDGFWPGYQQRRAIQFLIASIFSAPPR